MDLFLLGQQAALDDHLQDLAPGGLPHGTDVIGHIHPAAVLHHGEIDHHVDLVGAVLNGVGGLKGFGGGGHIPVGEADDGAQRQLIPYITLGSGHMAGRDAHAGAVILYGLVAKIADFLAGAVHPQQGMVAFFKDLFDIHMITPSVNYLCPRCLYYTISAVIFKCAAGICLSISTKRTA